MELGLRVGEMRGGGCGGGGQWGQEFRGGARGLEVDPLGGSKA